MKESFREWTVCTPTSRGMKTSQSHDAARAGSQRSEKPCGQSPTWPCGLTKDSRVPIVCVKCVPDGHCLSVWVKLGKSWALRRDHPDLWGPERPLSQYLLRRLLWLEAPLQLHLGGLFVPVLLLLLLLTPNGI